MTILSSLDAKADELRFFNFVNMCAPEFKCDFKLDDAEVVPGGLRSGAETGWFLMPKKIYRLNVSSPAAENLAAALEAEDNSIFVIYAEAKTKEEGKSDYKLKLLRLPTHSPEQPVLRFVSLSAVDQEFDFSGQTATLKPLEISKSERSPRKPISVSFAGIEIAKIEEQAEAANRYIIVSDQKGKPAIATAVNSNQVSLK